MPTWQVEGATNRVDKLIAAHLGVSVGQAKRLVAQGLVRVNGKRVVKGTVVTTGATIEVKAEVRAGPLSYNHVLQPDTSALIDVVFEDAHLLVVNKPPGVASHPLRENERGTVAHAIVARCPACAEASASQREGGLVHRLDKGTSGALIAAKTREVWTRLREAFTDHQVEKTYWALVEGVPIDEGMPGIVIDAPLVTRKGLAVVAHGNPEALAARTEARVLAHGKKHALVEARARTGRLHQIRAHLASIGHPLCGDQDYGAPHADGIPDGQAVLHARTITLPHPIDGWRVTYSAPVPSGRRQLMERLLGTKLPKDGPTGR